jgi:hypothetical protein
MRRRAKVLKFRSKHRQRIASLGKQSIEANKYQPIKNTEGLPSRSGAPQNVDLLPKHPDLCLQCRSRSHQVNERPEKSACLDRSSPGHISRFVSARQLDLVYDRDRPSQPLHLRLLGPATCENDAPSFASRQHELRRRHVARTRSMGR